MSSSSASGGGTAHLRHGDGPVQRHHGRGRVGEELVVQRDDLRPVGVGRSVGVAVDCGDRGLDLIGPGRLRRRQAHNGLSLGDQVTVPAVAVLVAQAHERSRGVGGRLAATP